MYRRIAVFLIDGYKKNYLDVSDRSTQFGDGSFTTAYIINGRVCLHDAHLQRLKKACKKLFIPFTQWDILEYEMKTLVSNVDRGVLKVIISRGSGGRGYSIDECFHPRRILSVSPYPEYYDTWRNLGVRLIESPIRLGRNPRLAGIKHLNRLEQILIHINLKHSGADEALVLDSEGIVTSCCAANLFWRKGNKVFTPLIKYSGVSGIMRNFCISQLKFSPFQVFEITTGLQELWNSDEAIISNALIPIAPVKCCKIKQWKSRDLYQFLAPLCEKNKHE